MKRILTKVGTCAALAAGAGGLIASPALAATTSSTVATSPATASGQTLANIKAKAATAISVRQNALQLAVSDVRANEYLTDADRATLLNTLQDDQSGLTTLGQTIQGDTTVAKAEADYKLIFTGYRVFALALPQVRFAASTDDLTGTVVPHLTDAQTKLQALLSGPDKSKDTPAVQAKMDDLANQISAITTDTNGLAATILSFTPAQWDANPYILTAPVSQLRTARSDAKQARADIAYVVQAIKS
ncbi:MAG TPA: hypothetical protein VG435_11500 [Acidimicrobiales bacterium]|jgi:hypothetical protein|nr:hypothetical protein [Acidimicrobiales bacterium]